MPHDPRWPTTRFGQDLTKAIPNFIQIVGDETVFVPSFMKGPFPNIPESGIAGPFPYQIQMVTTASAVVNPGSTIVLVNRNGPNATSLTLPLTSAQELANADTGIPIIIADISINITGEHIISINPAGAETVMRQAPFPIVSHPGILTGITLTPVDSIGMWVVVPG